MHCGKLSQIFTCIGFFLSSKVFLRTQNFSGQRAMFQASAAPGRFPCEEQMTSPCCLGMKKLSPCYRQAEGNCCYCCYAFSWVSGRGQLLWQKGASSAKDHQYLCHHKLFSHSSLTPGFNVLGVSYWDGLHGQSLVMLRIFFWAVDGRSPGAFRNIPRL